MTDVPALEHPDLQFARSWQRGKVTPTKDVNGSSG